MNRRGLSFLELLLVLLVMGVVVNLTFAPLRRQVDEIVLRATGEEVVSLFHRARMEARLGGGASLHFLEGADPFLQLPGERSPLRVTLLERGVNLEVAGVRDQVEIHYGPLGLASVASATLILRRRGAEMQLVVSGYGRVRR